MTNEILGRLSDLGSRVLRACGMSKMTSEIAATQTEVAAQLTGADAPKVADALRYLSRFDPPLLTHAGSAGYTFTFEGGLAARACLSNQMASPVKPTSGPSFLTSQASLDREMESHAGLVGAVIWRADEQRCDGCGHKQSYGLRRGNRHLCQVCFKRGRRFK